MESIPPQEKSSESSSELISKLVKGKLDSFIKLYEDTGGKPGEFLTREEELKLEEEAKTDPKAGERLGANEKSVYRISKLTGVLSGISFLLESSAGKETPEAFKEKFSKVLDKVNHVHDVHFSDEEQKSAIGQIQALALSDKIKNSFVEKIGALLARGRVSRLELNNVFRSEINSMEPEEKQSFLKAEGELLIEKKIDEAEEKGDLLITKELIESVVDLIKETYQYLK